MLFIKGVKESCDIKATTSKQATFEIEHDFFTRLYFAKNKFISLIEMESGERKIVRYRRVRERPWEKISVGLGTFDTPEEDVWLTTAPPSMLFI